MPSYRMYRDGYFDSEEFTRAKQLTGDWSYTYADGRVVVGKINNPPRLLSHENAAEFENRVRCWILASVKSKQWESCRATALRAIREEQRTKKRHQYANVLLVAYYLASRPLIAARRNWLRLLLGAAAVAEILHTVRP